MQTITELQNQLESVRLDINEHHSAIDVLEKRKTELQIQLAAARYKEAEIAKRRARHESMAAEREAQRIAKAYAINWNDKSKSRFVNQMAHYFMQPRWLGSSDPLEDGHDSHSWQQTLWLVEFYAKHHPDHPEHANREYKKIAPIQVHICLH